ncbi:cupin domain-containing protein [Paenibacillus glycanilyticus]|uniref:cupin domain-containing protein n=1 Tax=Paenibacillus glycanilyticus TaxID=126569 RepID=UPI00203FD48E|nr:cupin domain-containing protein [Paenibacillus glycanilyticus]MCM3627066.1 cupin domain-containing protein [Paenibacillus glycanilyticus]
MNQHNGLQRAVFTHSKDLEWFTTMPGEQMAIRIHSSQVGGAVTIMEARVPFLSGPPKHFHKEREEIFEVLEGTFRFQCGEDDFEVTPGTSVVVPRGVPHAWTNVGTESGRILFTFAPGGIDDVFAKIGLTPPEGWQELCENYDTWIVGPPMLISNK